MTNPRRTTRSAFATLTTGLLLVGAAVPALAESHQHGMSSADEPESFTSMFSIAASAEEVVDNGGEPGATGRFDLRLDAESDTICYDIVLDGVTPPYDSPANTGTHIHEGAEGVAGPPRVVFPDPEMQQDGTLTSSGCVTGPWMTGVGPEGGGDHGDAFSVAMLEADPSAYYVDTHTTDFMAGAVRGQFDTPVPMGGMDTGDGSVSAVGAGMTAGTMAGAAGLLGLAAAVGLAGFSMRGARRQDA